MKKLFALLSIVMLLAWACHKKSDGYRIKGQITGLKSDTVMVRYRTKNSAASDSAVVENGHFTFTGEVAFPTLAQVKLGKNKKINFYIENSDISLKGSIDSLDNVTISGSKSNEDYEQLETQLSSLEGQIRKVRKREQQARKKDRTQVLDKLRAKAGSLYHEQTEQRKKFVEDHPDSYVSLRNMYALMHSYDYEEVAPLYDRFSKELKSSPIGKEVGKLVEAKKRTQVGAQAPGFTLKSLEGKQVSLKSYRGQYVLVDFWASWCKPCRKEHPNYIEAFKRHKDQNFTILSVSLDKKRKKWKQAVKKDGLLWTQVSSLKGMLKSEVATRYGIRAIPQNYLLNPEGEIIAKNLRGQKLEQKLKEIFS